MYPCIVPQFALLRLLTWVLELLMKLQLCFVNIVLFASFAKSHVLTFAISRVLTLLNLGVLAFQSVCLLC